MKKIVDLLKSVGSLRSMSVYSASSMLAMSKLIDNEFSMNSADDLVLLLFLKPLMAPP